VSMIKSSYQYAKIALDSTPDASNVKDFYTEVKGKYDELVGKTAQTAKTAEPSSTTQQAAKKEPLSTKEKLLSRVKIDDDDEE